MRRVIYILISVPCLCLLLAGGSASASDGSSQLRQEESSGQTVRIDSATKRHHATFALGADHWPNLADFDEFAPDTGQIKGPITIFQLGLSF